MNMWFSWCDLLAFVQQWSCTCCAMQEHGPVQYQCAQLLPGWGPTTCECVCVCVWDLFVNVMFFSWRVFSAPFLCFGVCLNAGWPRNRLVVTSWLCDILVYSSTLASAQIESTRPPKGELPNIGGLNLIWVYCVHAFFAIVSSPMGLSLSEGTLSLARNSQYLNSAQRIGLGSECEIWESRISESLAGRSVMLQCHQKQDCRPSIVICVS